MTSPPRVSRTARLLARLALRHPLRVVIAGGLIAAVGIWLASQLALQTSIAELLPADAPSVIALRALGDRVGGTGNVAIAIESVDGKPDALRRYVPRLAQALRDDLGKELLSIRYSHKEVADYYKRFAAYYVPLPQLTDWADRATSTVALQANPAYIDLDGTGKAAIKKLADDIRAERDKTQPKTQVVVSKGQVATYETVSDPQTGLLISEGGKLAVVFVRPAANSLDLAGSEAMLERIQRVVDATRPADVRIAGYTGSIPTALTEVAAVKHDIVSTAILVLLGVGGVVIVFFRGVRELALISGAVIVGAAVALGFAELWIGHVNAQTAFLGAIIVCTGINYGIIFLDRYRQARVESDSFDAALELACADTLRATWIAALATAVSFGVLAAGEVESFHQFGWIGGIGILACWLSTFTIVPACVVLSERDRAPRRLPKVQPLARALGWLARGCRRAPRTVVVVALVGAAASAAIAIHARHDIVETDMRKLGTKSSSTNGIEKLDNRLRAMDDRSSTPAVIATHSRAETLPVCDALNVRAKTDLAGILRRCYSIDDLFPHDLDRRTPVMARLRHAIELIDDDELDADERDQLGELRRALDERPPGDADLPATLAEYFVERDGSIGKLAYVEPHNEHVEANLYKFTDAIRAVRLPSGKVIESSGDLVVFADVLRAMRRDATKLTIAAALLVLLVLGVVTRRAGSFVRVGGALIAGVALMSGVAVLLGQRLNFFNFVALPTTFGIGIDYVINIEERIRRRGIAVLPEAVAEAGPAVVLASLTSIIGYASLLTADSRALSSFGALAMVGEVCCLAVAVTMLPAMWAVFRRRNAG
jgi:hypothetical protein